MPTIRLYPSRLGGGGGSGVRTFNPNIYQSLMTNASPPPADSAAEQDLASYVLPANTLGANGCLWFYIGYKARANVATGMSLRIKFGGTIVFNHDYGVNIGNGAHIWEWGFIQNKNAAGTQHFFLNTIFLSGTYDFGSLSFNAATAGPDVSSRQVSLDTTVNQTLLFTVDYVSSPGFNPSAEVLAAYIELLK